MFQHRTRLELNSFRRSRFELALRCRRSTPVCKHSVCARAFPNRESAAHRFSRPSAPMPRRARSRVDRHNSNYSWRYGTLIIEGALAPHLPGSRSRFFSVRRKPLVQTADGVRTGRVRPICQRASGHRGCNDVWRSPSPRPSSASPSSAIEPRRKKAFPLGGQALLRKKADPSRGSCRSSRREVLTDPCMRFSEKAFGQKKRLVRKSVRSEKALGQKKR